MSRKWIAVWIIILGMLILLLPQAIPAGARNRLPKTTPTALPVTSTNIIYMIAGNGSACAMRPCTVSIVMAVAPTAR